MNYTQEKPRKNLIFCKISELTDNEIEKFKKYYHIHKKIELGEVKTEEI